MACRAAKVAPEARADSPPLRPVTSEPAPRHAGSAAALLLTGVTGSQPVIDAWPSEAAPRPVASARREVTLPSACLHSELCEHADRSPTAGISRRIDSATRFAAGASAPLTAHDAGSTVSPRNLSAISLQKTAPPSASGLSAPPTRPD